MGDVVIVDDAMRVVIRDRDGSLAEVADGAEEAEVEGARQNIRRLEQERRRLELQRKAKKNTQAKNRTFNQALVPNINRDLQYVKQMVNQHHFAELTQYQHSDRFYKVTNYAQIAQNEDLIAKVLSQRDQCQFYDQLFCLGINYKDQCFDCEKSADCCFMWVFCTYSALVCCPIFAIHSMNKLKRKNFYLCCSYRCCGNYCACCFKEQMRTWRELHRIYKCYSNKIKPV